MSFDSTEVTPSRYVVGIDLGTTNSALSYVDSESSRWSCDIFPIPQIVAPGQVEARDTLPSFHYQAAEGENATGSLRTRWQSADPSYVVGVYARDHGAKVPGRLISSAKSWLCHGGVDRTAEILPWHGGADVERLSPIEVSARFLKHMREAWDAAHPHHSLAAQEVVLTLPASFDEVARELTITAAARAGLPRVVLIEEPQAAFYAWLNKHASDWEQRVSPGQKILVCDIGGGTSDFTLIRVRRGEADKVLFHRVAVGEHLILGGDNLDLALAHFAEQKITGGKQLEPRAFDVLVRLCRQAKETLLGPNPPPSYSLTLPGSGSKLIGGSLQCVITADDARTVLLDGFLPYCDLNEKPAQRRSGFQEFGLPFAADAAITRYLAAFLTAHRFVALDEVEANSSTANSSDPARPDIVLFNGGMFDSPAMRERLLAVLSSWFSKPGEPQWQPHVLENDRLDLAVARGAAYYGMVRRGLGVRISANLARSYYIGLDSDPPVAMCVLPGSAEPGHEFQLKEHPLELRISEPVEFPLYVSSVRLVDAPGSLVPVDEEQFTSLPPLRTALKTQRRSERGTLPVFLHAKLTEIGTLDLGCTEVDGPRSWRLQFDVRSTTQTDIAAVATSGELLGLLDERTWQAAESVIHDTFSPEGRSSPDQFVKSLTAALEVERSQWPPSLLRRLWESLLAYDAGRRKSPAHEARWLNLLGYALRPGYGMAVDDWRVAETWRLLSGKFAHAAATTRTESLILWRRIAGGLTTGQQKSIADSMLPVVKALHKRFASGGAKGGDALSPHEANETLRLLGSLELLAPRTKIELGTMLVDLAGKKKLDAMRGATLWAIGRLAARVPLHGPLNTVVAAEIAQRWVEQLWQTIDGQEPMLSFVVVQATRRTEDRYRDVDEEFRRTAFTWLESHGASAHQLELVRQGGATNMEEAGRIFGESLPMGLRLRRES